MEYVVRPRGPCAVLEGPELPAHIEYQLREHLAWADPLNLDATRYFYSDKKAYTGTMTALRDKLQEFGFPCKVDLGEVSPKDFDWEFLWDFRPLQEAAVETMIRERYGVFKAPPGIGKTVVMAAVCARLGKQAAIVVQAEEPFNQALDKLRNATSIGSVGHVGGSKAVLGDVTVFMIQSLATALADDPDGEVAQHFRRCKVVLIDECHHFGALSYQLLHANLRSNVEYLLGVSATPERGDERELFVWRLLGPVIHEITYSDAIANKLLAPLTVCVWYTPEKNYGYTEKKKKPSFLAKNKAEENKEKFTREAQYRKVYKEQVIQSKLRNSKGVDYARKANENGHTCAIIVSRVEHAYALQELMPEAVVIHGKSPDRTEVIAKLQNHEVMTVITTLFDEAVDVPSLGAVALMSGGKSLVKLQQRLRSLRTFQGETSKGYVEKLRGYVFYPFDQCDFLEPHSAICLATLKKYVKACPEYNEIYFIGQKKEKKK